jgi:uncharacterized protein YkwD
MISFSRTICSLLTAGALCSALSCTSSSKDASRPSSAPAASQKQLRPIAVAKLERQIHDRVNEERTRRGLPTMRWDDALGRIAGRHSRDMARNDYFSHTSPDGHDYSYRYMKAGYACGITVNGVLRRGAESIYRLSLDAGRDPAEEALRGWLANSDDRENLLASPWQRQGIGVCLRPDGVLYITLNFC